MNKPREAALLDAVPAHAPSPGVGVPHPHESAHLHVAGEATYVDDMPELAGTLHAAFGLSPVAHGRLKSIDLDAVRKLPGVVDAFGADAIPGRNDCGPIVHDDPILADGTVWYLGQPVFVVLAHTRDAARRAAAQAKKVVAIDALAAGADGARRARQAAVRAAADAHRARRRERPRSPPRRAG